MLGRGLNSLIPTSAGKVREEVAREIAEELESGAKIMNVPVDQIRANPYQPRQNFSYQAQEDLINSIKEHGIIEPLILTLESDGAYQIIAGERRFRAAQFLQMPTVPAILRKATEQEKLEISLIENIQRQELNPLEKAKSYQRLIDEFSLGEQEIAQRVGKARSTIANSLRLLSLPLIIQKALSEEKITEGHAKAILSLDDQTKQEIMLKRILGLDLTVREAEKITRGKTVYKTVELDTNLLEKEKELRDHFNCKVRIQKNGKKIKVIFETREDEDFNKLLSQFQAGPQN